MLFSEKFFYLCVLYLKHYLLMSSNPITMKKVWLVHFVCKKALALFSRTQSGLVCSFLNNKFYIHFSVKFIFLFLICMLNATQSHLRIKNINNRIETNLSLFNFIFWSDTIFRKMFLSVYVILYQ